MNQNKFFLFSIIWALSTIFFSNKLIAQTAKPGYNKALADSLGADDFGMKNYVLVILKTGTFNTDNKVLRDSLFKGHMENIGRLAKNGKLVVAGPLQKNERTYRGIFILNAATVEEAKLLVDTDPAVKAKMFDTEMFTWYGSAALPLYLPHHETLQKKKM